jgi:hypothetical protein
MPKCPHSLDSGNATRTTETSSVHGILKIMLYKSALRRQVNEIGWGMTKACIILSPSVAEKII